MSDRQVRHIQFDAVLNQAAQHRAAQKELAELRERHEAVAADLRAKRKTLSEATDAYEDAMTEAAEMEKKMRAVRAEGNRRRNQAFARYQDANRELARIVDRIQELERVVPPDPGDTAALLDVLSDL